MVRGGVRGWGAGGRGEVMESGEVGGGVGKLLELWSGTKRLHSAIKLIKICRQACIMMMIIIASSF